MPKKLHKIFEEVFKSHDKEIERVNAEDEKIRKKTREIAERYGWKCSITSFKNGHYSIDAEELYEARCATLKWKGSPIYWKSNKPIKQIKEDLEQGGISEIGAAIHLGLIPSNPWIHKCTGETHGILEIYNWDVGFPWETSYRRRKKFSKRLFRILDSWFKKFKVQKKEKKENNNEK